LGPGHWLPSFVYYTEPSPIFDLQILGGIELGGMARTPWEDRLCLHSPCKRRSCVICSISPKTWRAVTCWSRARNSKSTHCVVTQVSLTKSCGLEPFRIGCGAARWMTPRTTRGAGAPTSLNVPSDGCVTHINGREKIPTTSTTL